MKSNDGLQLKYEIPVTTKLTGDQFLAMIQVKNREKMDTSTFLRLAVVNMINLLARIESEEKPRENSEEVHIPIDNLKFRIRALEKYLVANGLPIPSDEELTNLWLNGKTIPMPWMKKKVLVVPEPLPEAIERNNKQNGTTE